MAGPRRARAAVLWTGGKDCTLALIRSGEAGLETGALVTFAPPGAAFRAHPLGVLAEQAAALGLPHRVVPIEAPYDVAYRRAFEALFAEGFTHLVTGDIDRVAGMPNWVRQCARGLGVEVVTPLWGGERGALLADVARRGLRAVISCVRPPLPPELCGRALDEDALRDIRAAGADLCGENGEYHTLVLDGPGFRWPLTLDATASTASDGLTTLAVRNVVRGAVRD